MMKRVDIKVWNTLTASHEFTHAFISCVDKDSHIFDEFKKTFKATADTDIDGLEGSYDDIHSVKFQERFAKEFEYYLANGRARNTFV